MSTIYETGQTFRDNLQLNIVRIDEQLNVEPDHPPEKTQHNPGIPGANNIAEIPTCASQIQPPTRIGIINQRQEQLEEIITTGIRTATSPTQGQPITSTAGIDSGAATVQEISAPHNNATSTFTFPATNTIHTHVVTCSSPLCQANIVTNTQSRLHTAMIHQQDHRPIPTPGIAHTYQT